MGGNQWDHTNRVKTISGILGFPWVEIAAETWKLYKKVFRALSNEGMYEVLEYESTLELLDERGKKAYLKKRKKVRYLQDNIIAFQDYAWGDGDFLKDYKVSPGKAVDQYKIGYKTYSLISLREIRNKGDIDEFNISWNIKNGFLLKDGFWETDISHRTKHIHISIIFPKKRPPTLIQVIEQNQKRSHLLGVNDTKQLPDCRWKVSWNKRKPRLFENYLLKWKW